MNAPESPPDLLRRAAAAIEQRAEHATPGPWELEYRYGNPHLAQALFVGCRPDGCDEPGDCFDGTHGIGGLDRDCDNRWAALMYPGVAPALAAWLRDGADRCTEAQARWEAGPQWQGVGDDDLPPRMTAEKIRANVEHHWRHELAFARALLGENQP